MTGLGGRPVTGLTPGPTNPAKRRQVDALGTDRDGQVRDSNPQPNLQPQLGIGKVP